MAEKTKKIGQLELQTTEEGFWNDPKQAAQISKELETLKSEVEDFEKLEKNALYRLADAFSLFYFRFMHSHAGAGKTSWPGNEGGKAYTTWCGYAFENICFTHAWQIKKALQVAGVQSSQYSWYKPGTQTEEGAQIDLLIDRADNCINVCEIKFSRAWLAEPVGSRDPLVSRLREIRQPSRAAVLLRRSATASPGWPP